jgi:hypothetical protein
MVSVVILIWGGIVAHVSFPHYAAATTVTSAIAPVELLRGSSAGGTVITLDGELVCLPHRAGKQEELTLACAVGLRTTPGKAYALANINPYLMGGKVAMGQHVKVSGHLRPSTDMRYEASGTIDITSVTILDPLEPTVNP